MKFYTIATVTNECYGHGDYARELRICKNGPYGTGVYPPLFQSEIAALRWMEENLKFDRYEVVELEVHKE